MILSNSIHSCLSALPHDVRYKLHFSFVDQCNLSIHYSMSKLC